MHPKYLMTLMTELQIIYLQPGGSSCRHMETQSYDSVVYNR